MNGQERSGRLPVAAPREARARVLALLRARLGPVVLLVAVTSVGTVASLAGPALIGVVVDAAASGSGTRSTAAWAALAYAAAAAIGALVRFRAGILAAGIGESSLDELRSEAFDHAMALPIDEIERAGTGEVVSRLTGDVAAMGRAVRQTVPLVVFATFEVAFVVVALVLVDRRLALAGLAGGVPLAAIGGAWYARHAPSRYRLERQVHADRAAALLEAYRGRRTLVAYDAADRRRAHLATLGRSVVDAELATAAARNRLRPAVSLGLAGGLCAVVGAGVVLADAGSASLGVVTAAALYTIRLFDPVGVLLEQTDEVQQASVATARLVGLAAVAEPTAAGGGTPRSGTPRQREASAHPDPTGPAAVGIDLRAVTFGYRPGLPVLSGLDLTVEAGQHVVLVGTSGAGKSTIARLLCGVHRPWAGEVLLGGVAVSDLDPSTTARTVVMVAQEGHVFSGTIADNVRLARPDLGDDEVWGALRAVDADRWIARMPDGIDTMVGAGHHALGPAPAQQLGLARVVAADPSVVVLDEATAELDPVAAASTERHLDAVLAGRTVVVVAHRLDVAARADRVVVIDCGRVVADGSHDALLSTSPDYAAMWSTWSAERGGDRGT